MHPGYYFIGDNVDMKTGVRQMTNDKTKSKERPYHHMYNICAYMNRVEGNLLDNTTLKADITCVPFSTFIRDENDKENLLDDMAFLIAQKWCDFIPWLHPYL